MADQKLAQLLKRGVGEWNEVTRKRRFKVWGQWSMELTGADLAGADFEGADLRGADLRSVDLRGANLGGADLEEANLRGAKLGGFEISAYFTDSPHLSDFRLRGTYLNCTSLIGANLRGADFYEATLAGAKLNEAILKVAELPRVDLKGADLEGADLKEANLRGANLEGANLEGANLEEADLRDSNIVGTNLTGANLARSLLGGTRFVSSDLTNALGLMELRHEGPSSVDTLTLAHSRGRIPDDFLKGVGFEDWEILAANLYDPDLTPHQYVDITYRLADLRTVAPIQPNSVFISYTHTDRSFVDSLQEALNEKAVRSWRDIHHAEAGPLDKVIDRAISLNPTIVLVLSQSSVESEWVRWEVKKAIQLEKELERPVLCPIALDGAWRDCRWPVWLRERIEEYTVLDYSGDDAINEMMPRLLKGLRIHYRA